MRDVRTVAESNAATGSDTEAHRLREKVAALEKERDEMRAKIAKMLEALV